MTLVLEDIFPISKGDYLDDWMMVTGIIFSTLNSGLLTNGVALAHFNEYVINICTHNTHKLSRAHDVPKT